MERGGGGGSLSPPKARREGEGFPGGAGCATADDAIYAHTSPLPPSLFALLAKRRSMAWGRGEGAAQETRGNVARRGANGAHPQKQGGLNT